MNRGWINKQLVLESIARKRVLVLIMKKLSVLSLIGSKINSEV